MNEAHKPRQQFTVRSLLIITAIAGLSAFLISLAGDRAAAKAFRPLGFIIAVGLVGWTGGFIIRGTKESAAGGAIILVLIMLFSIFMNVPGAAFIFIILVLGVFLFFKMLPRVEP